MLNKRKEGFTLIEVVVVMAIIAVLAVLVIGAITVAKNTAIETQNRTNAHILQSSFEAYYAKYKTWPTFNSNTCPGDYYCSFRDLANDGTAGSGSYTSQNWTPPKIQPSCSGTGNKWAGTFSDDDGGLVTSSSSGGYTIYMANYNCSTGIASNFNDDVIQGQ